MIASLRALVERAHARRLRRTLTSVPRHVAIVTDGNRRWARQMGYADRKIDFLRALRAYAAGMAHAD